MARLAEGVALRETRVVAFAFQFTAAGLVALVIGWWTRAKADQLADAKTRFCRRFIPGRLVPLAARIIDAAGYRLAGVFLMAFGALVTFVFLLGWACSEPCPCRQGCRLPFAGECCRVVLIGSDRHIGSPLRGVY